MNLGEWRSAGESGVFSCAIWAADNPRHQLGSRTVMSIGDGFVRLSSTYPLDPIYRPPTYQTVIIEGVPRRMLMGNGVLMLYREAIRLDWRLSLIIGSFVRRNGSNLGFQQRSLSWFRNPRDWSI